MSSNSSPSSYPLLAASEPRPVRPLAIRSVRERRLNEFIGGQYGQYNLASLLFENKVDGSEPEYQDVFKLEKWSPSIGAKPSWKEAKEQKFIECKKGEAFGPSWTNHWMKVYLKIPREWKKKERLELEFDPSCEALIFNENGEALQGITGGFGGDRRVDLPIKKEWLKKDMILFYIEISCNGMFGVDSTGNGSDPDPNRFFVLNSCDLVIKRPSVWSLMWDFNVLKQLVEELPKDSILQNKALWICNEIMNVFRKDDLESVDRCRILAQEVLGKDWEKESDEASTSSSSSKAGEEEQTIVWSLGHTHIDSAWLWPFSVTQQKVARSWSTQLSLMERYPEHQFTASTAQQYQWLEQLYPELFKRVTEKVKEGKFVPIGGSWVENDANLPSGEAFVRQFLYGQRYFLTRFGARSKVFWLPDTFGYNSQIPQLARGCGMDYFFTQKLSWSNVNRFPHHSMNWVGLDGTQIISHLTPVDNYDSQCGVNDILKAVKNNKNLDVQPTALHLFGFGDGGGGPTAPMLESLRRIRAINKSGGKEIPKSKVTKSAVDFFENLRKITHNGSRLPSWEGELYLEFHRAVFTSHGSIKRWNRKLEILMHNIEWTATLASIQASSTYKFPKKEIDSLWEPLLTNQFHDVLPGSSIRLVYDDAERIYKEIAKKGMKLLAEATHALSSSISSPSTGAESPDLASLSILNTLDIPRRELVTVSLEHEGMSVNEVQAIQQKSVQVLDSGKKALLLFDDSLSTGIAKALHPSDSTSIMRKLEAVTVSSEGHNVFTMQNSMVSIRVSNGRIASIYDRQSRREILSEGRTAGLTICEDYPPQFDAWETEMTSLETEEELKFDRVRISENGPWRSSLTLISSFGKSQVELVITLDAIPANSNVSVKGSARSYLRFDANIDWFEKHRFLRFSLPTNLRSDYASYETQFGITNRPTSRNTSWEAAKFEVCGHKFADLSEGSGSYGVALLSDSKYGFSTEGGTMRLSLLKAPTYPDATTDEGNHRFSFGIYPHLGGLAQSDVIDVGRIFNNPLEVYPTLHHDFDELNKDEHFENFIKNSRSLSNGVHAFGSSRGYENPISIRSSVNPSHGSSTSVILDTIKRGEQDFDYDNIKAIKGKTVIVRMYESLGAKTEARLSTSLPVKSISLCNLLEDDLPKEEQILKAQNVSVGTGRSLTVVALSFRGFEVKTVKLYLK